ncbi:hypothetical protein N7470_000740 [Penicillium chermesinum]|nr:hypothetical protein N7470_000740 [Penicillium chermesinum]
MYPRPFSRGPWEEGLADPPSPRSLDTPEHPAHIRSRSSAHAHSQSPKRLSVFSRSRSNTTNTTFSTSGSPVNSMEDPAPQPEERSASSLGWRSDRNSRSFLARGSRILRRQGSKVNVVATLDEETEMAHPESSLPPRPDRPERPEKADRPETSRRHRSRHQDHHERLKRIISDPYDFHHLTHTSVAQFQTIDRAREHDLVTEFSIMRASQRPETGLKGIRAEDIHLQSSSTEEVNTLGMATTVDEPTPQGSPRSPQPSMGSPQMGHERRHSRQFENFSRPVPRYPRSCPTTPPPHAIPETPSEAESAPLAIDAVLESSTPKTIPADAEAHSPSIYSVDSSEEMSRQMSLSSQYDLQDVPEEEEVTRMWDSPEPSIGYAHSRSVSQASQPHSRSVSQVSQNASYPTKATGPKRPLSIVVAEELSRKFSEALGSPTLPQNLPESSPQSSADPQDPPPEAPRPPTVAGVHSFPYEEEVYDSWDADIDYCYEHAAESTSNFDWTRSSLDEARPQIATTTTEELQPWLAAPKARQLEPSPLSTSTLRRLIWKRARRALHPSRLPHPLQPTMSGTSSPGPLRATSSP